MSNQIHWKYCLLCETSLARKHRHTVLLITSHRAVFCAECYGVVLPILERADRQTLTGAINFADPSHKALSALMTLYCVRLGIASANSVMWTALGRVGLSERIPAKTIAKMCQGKYDAHDWRTRNTAADTLAPEKPAPTEGNL